MSIPAEAIYIRLPQGIPHGGSLPETVNFQHRVVVIPQRGSLQHTSSHIPSVYIHNQMCSLAAGNNVALRALSSGASANLLGLASRLNTGVSITIFGTHEAGVIQGGRVSEIGVDSYHNASTIR